MSGLFGSVSAPAVEPPARMPSPNDKKTTDARRRQAASMKDRQGRDSTILSQNLMGTSGKLGA